MKKETIKIVLGYTLISILWGTTWYAIRIGLNSLTPIFAAGLRFTTASIFIYAIMRYSGARLQTDKLSLILYVAMGFFSFVIPFGLVYWGEQYVSSGLTSVLFGSFPFFVILFSRFAFPNEKIGILKLLGVVLAFIGIVVIFFDSLSFTKNNLLIGMIAVVSSAALQGAIAVVIKKWGNHLHSLSMNFIPLVIAGITMLLFGLLFEDRTKWDFNSSAILSVLYLALFGTVFTFTTYYWLMKKIDVVILSLSSFITPIIALIVGSVLLAEHLSFLNFIGSSLVLVGILFANLRGLIKYYSQKQKLEIN